jgi:hypothetical protein
MIYPAKYIDYKRNLQLTTTYEIQNIYTCKTLKTSPKVSLLYIQTTLSNYFSIIIDVQLPNSIRKRSYTPQIHQGLTRAERQKI